MYISLFTLTHSCLIWEKQVQKHEPDRVYLAEIGKSTSFSGEVTMSSPLSFPGNKCGWSRFPNPSFLVVVVPLPPSQWVVLVGILLEVVLPSTCSLVGGAAFTSSFVIVVLDCAFRCVYGHGSDGIHPTQCVHLLI